MNTTTCLPTGVARFLLAAIVVALIVLAVVPAPGPQRAGAAHQGGVPAAPQLLHPTMSGEFAELPFA